MDEDVSARLLKQREDICINRATDMASCRRGFVRADAPAARDAYAAAFALAACIMSLAAPVGAQPASPPPVTVLQNSGSLAGGLIFIGPQDKTGAANPSQGPEIIDDKGRPRWFLPTPGNVATDFRVQIYNANPVLTWSQGVMSGDENPGDTTDYIMDDTYTVIAKVQAGNGYNADIHEFQLTPQNTALITIYNSVPWYLSSVGGPVNGNAVEGVVQEIDVASGNVVFEWHSLPNVTVDESYLPYTGSTDPKGFDYFHINSVKLDTDGNLLISARHTWTVYKVNRTTGAIIWRLGGKKSDFALGAGLPFAWQHDVEAADSQTLRIFDNESDGIPVLPYSRVIWVHHDDTAMSANVIQSIAQPSQLSAVAEGGAQALPNGDTFVEWGLLGGISEFNPAGQLLFNADEAPGYGSYRGFRFPWVGRPATPPTAIAYPGANGSTDVHAVWNGATQVASWEVLAGETPGALGVMATAPWNGLDTVIPIADPVNYIQVVALDSNGTTIGTSATISGASAVFSAQPASQTVAAGRSVAFSAVASYPTPPSYQWYFNGSPLTNGTSGGAKISGATDSTLLITGTTPSNAGAYSCVATSPGYSGSSNPANLTIIPAADAGRLANISCRAIAGAGDGALIVGLVVGGQGTSGSDSLLIRASGPALAQFGISSALPDPGLQLYGPNGIIASDYGWAGSAQIVSAAALVGAFPWSSASSLDSALDISTSVGPLTAVISGASGDTGVALGEVYDAIPSISRVASTPRLINLSARAQVGTGVGVLIAGFVIGGTSSETVLIRGSGPALAQFGVTRALADPTLQLYGSNSDGTSTLIGSNSGWKGNAQIAATAASVGAFSWGASATADSALLVTLPPGPYTAEITGANGDTGVSLVEVYEVP